MNQSNSPSYAEFIGARKGGSAQFTVHYLINDQQWWATFTAYGDSTLECEVKAAKYAADYFAARFPAAKRVEYMVCRKGDYGFGGI